MHRRRGAVHRTREDRNRVEVGAGFPSWNAQRAVIAEVVNLRERGLSIRAITAHLDEQGVIGRTGKPLSVASIHRMVKAA